MLALDQLYERCWTWADDFMPTARDEYEGLIAGDIDNSEIPQTTGDVLGLQTQLSYVCSPGCYYEWTKDGADWMPLAEFIQDASLEPGSGQGALLVDAGLVAEGGITPFARAQLVSSAIEYIVNQAKARLQLEQVNQQSGSLKMPPTISLSPQPLQRPVAGTPVPTGPSRRVLLHAGLGNPGWPTTPAY